MIDWDNEFTKNWRSGIDGKFQTIHFAANAVANLNMRQLETIENAKSILDYGCALGNAKNIFKSINEDINYFGFDTSNVASNIGKDVYCEPAISDIVYSCNVMSYGITLQELAKNSRKMIVILEPYDQSFDGWPHEFDSDKNEDENPGLHTRQISLSDFPAIYGDLIRSTFKPIQITNKDLNSQMMVLVVYELKTKRLVYDVAYDKCESNARLNHLVDRQSICI